MTARVDAIEAESHPLSVQPLVSVIMNCLNCEKYVRQAIDSVFAQTYSNWEIIFWDNVSSDGSVAIAQSYADRRLRYFRGDSTVPLGRARNLAIEMSVGELVAFLDCDDVWLPTKLAQQVQLFRADPNVGLVYSDTVFFNDSGMNKRLYAGRTPYRGHCFENLLNRYLISLETAIIRRSALSSLDQWFNEEFNAIEEYDLFVRIGLDWKIDFVPEVLAKWRVHGESLTWKAPDRFSEEKKTMLNALETNPRVRTLHAHAMDRAWHAQAIGEAKTLWRGGNATAARARIRQNPIRSVKSTVFWIVTFFPYTAIQSLWNVVSRAAVPRAT